MLSCAQVPEVQPERALALLYRTLYPSGSWDGPSSKDAALSFNLNLPNITEGVAGGAASFELEIDGGREPCEPPSFSSFAVMLPLSSAGLRLRKGLLLPLQTSTSGS